MKLYQSIGPNPRVVLMYLEEKGIELPRQFIDIVAGENRQGPFLEKTFTGATPLLELDDGSHVSDSVAICEYLEDHNPQPPLIGTDPAEKARTRAILRHIDHTIVVPMTTGFRGAEGLPLFKDRMLCSPDAAPGNKAIAASGLAGIDRLLADRAFVAGDRFTLADIVLYAFVEFGPQVGQAIDPALTHLAAWRERIASRPSAAASANPENGIAVSA